MNIELLVFGVAAIGVTFAKHARPGWSAGFVGLAVGLKIYPLVFLVALPLDTVRNWAKRLAIAALCAVAITALGLSLVQQTPAAVFTGFRASLHWVERVYAIGDAGMPYGASMFTGIKAIHYTLGGTPDDGFAQAIYAPWAVVWLPATLVIMLGGVLLRFPVWVRLATAVPMILLASPITGSYRVVFLLIPIAFWIDYLLRARIIERRVDRLLHGMLAILFAAMLVPKTLWTIGQTQITSETLLSPLVLLVLLVVAAIAGWRSRGSTT
jgi:hypothetical protein